MLEGSWRRTEKSLSPVGVRKVCKNNSFDFDIGTLTIHFLSAGFRQLFHPIYHCFAQSFDQSQRPFANGSFSFDLQWSGPLIDGNSSGAVPFKTATLYTVFYPYQFSICILEFSVWCTLTLCCCELQNLALEIYTGSRFLFLWVDHY